MARNQNNKYGKQLNKRHSGAVSNIRFLIVCEGEKTEPNYFKRFPVATANIELIGVGYNTMSLINYTLELRKELNYSYETDQVWCVFDKDDFSDNDFNAAIHKAEANGINVAYSNEAFELWYLLHFDKHDTALHRDDYITKLSGKIKYNYKKNDGKMYPLLL